MRINIVRPYYGINVNGDMGGDLGIVDFSSQVTPDLSIIYAYSMLKSFGENVKIYDCNTDKFLASSFLSKTNFDAEDEIYVKFAAPTVNLDILFCRALKRKSPNSKIMVFGHSAKILKSWLNKNVSEISCVIEQPLDVEFVKKYRFESDCSSLDYLVTPYYEDFSYKTYNNTEQSMGYLWGSRGCTMGCDYCPYTAYYGRGIVFRSINKLIQDVKRLNEKGIDYIQFRDPFFTFNRQRVVQFCSAILQDNINVKWMCETRIDTLDEELLALMKSAGCESIAFGIETSNFEMMKKHSRNGYNMDEVKSLIRYCKNIRIDTLAFYMLGFETDTWEKLEETYHLACDLNSTYAQFNVFTFYPDTYEKIEGISPMFFVESKNLTQIKVNKLISTEALFLCAQNFTDSYYRRVFGLKYAINKRILENIIESRGNRVLEKEKEKISFFLQQE